MWPWALTSLDWHSTFYLLTAMPLEGLGALTQVPLEVGMKGRQGGILTDLPFSVKLEASSVPARSKHLSYVDFLSSMSVGTEDTKGKPTKAKLLSL